MPFDLSGWLPRLNETVDAIQSLAPLATTIGVPLDLVANVNGIVDAAQEAARTLAGAVDDGRVIATSQNQDELKALLARLEATSDELAAFIEGDTA